MKLSVTNQQTLKRDEKPFFFLADTCWSAFTNIQKDEWIRYLLKRKSQGFNTLQINILPQWDRSLSGFTALPFEETDGVYDFSSLNSEYFSRAQEMCQIADEHGFTLALVVLWANYVKGTWASQLDSEKNVFPKNHLINYFEKVIETFDDFTPMYFIGGDTDFPESETIDTYHYAFDYFERYSKKTLKTIHIKGRFTDIPNEIAERLDLFLYQSGHNHSFNNMPFYLAEEFTKKKQKLPIINSEPCYEQMGYARQEYGRFSQKDVRQAAWQSVLSGAFAGVTYGAHGIWSWHQPNSTFARNMGEAFDSPMIWHEALMFPGANDYGYIKYLFEMYQIENLIPVNECLVKGNEQIRISKKPDDSLVLIYIPSNTSIHVDMNLTEFKLVLVDLQTRYFYEPTFEIVDNVTKFATHSCKEDVLLIAYK